MTEGTSTNAWIVTADGVLVTRPASAAILNGVTRLALARLLAGDGIGWAERPFSVGEARAAREAFLTGTSAAVLPVTRIDGQRVVRKFLHNRLVSGDGQIIPSLLFPSAADVELRASGILTVRRRPNNRRENFHRPVQ